MTKEDLRKEFFRTKNINNKIYLSPDERIEYVEWLEDQYCMLEADNFLLKVDNKSSKKYIKDILNLRNK